MLVLKEREVLKRARGPVGYNVGSTDSGRLNKLSKEPLTWRRSPVRIRPSPSLFLESATLEPSIEAFSDTRIMAKKKHKKDKKLHNSDEKLHNSHELDLSWQETVDLLPEDEVEGGSEIYYFTDEDGNIHSREFLTGELIDNEIKDLEASQIEKSRLEEVQRLKPGTTDIVNLVRTPEETPKEIILPVPKSGARPLDIRISSEVTSDLQAKEESRQRIDVASQDRVFVRFHDGVSADEPTSARRDNTAAPLTFSFTRDALDQYVSYRNEGLAKKSTDWINRASQVLWESTQGEISHQTMTSFRTYVLSRYSSVDAHRKVLGFAAAFLKYLAQVRVDPRYLSFTLFLERPKTIMAKKALTERIVTREDIETVFQRIAAKEEKGTDPSKIRNYRAFTPLASYTGLRPNTIQRLTVGQFRTALNEEKPVLHVLAEQEKNRVEHYVPLHPSVVSAISEVLGHDFGEKETKLKYDGITVEPCKCEMVSCSVGEFTREAYIAVYGKEPIDWAKAKQEGATIPLERFVEVRRDVEGQQVIMQDTFTKTTIALKKADRAKWGPPPWENDD